MIAANKIWGLKEKICKENFNKRLILYKYLVRSVITYGILAMGRKKEIRKGYVGLCKVDLYIRF